MSGAVSVGPRRPVGWRPLVILVPAILDPLIDAAAHVVEAERVGREAADPQRLLGVIGLVAALAIGQTGLRVVAPPVFRGAAAARCVFPLRLAWQPIFPLRRLREPGDV